MSVVLLTEHCYFTNWSCLLSEMTHGRRLAEVFLFLTWLWRVAMGREYCRNSCHRQLWAMPSVYRFTESSRLLSRLMSLCESVITLHVVIIRYCLSQIVLSVHVFITARKRHIIWHCRTARSNLYTLMEVRINPCVNNGYCKHNAKYVFEYSVSLKPSNKCEIH